VTMPESARPPIPAEVVEAAVVAFEGAPEHNSDRDPDTTNRVAVEAAIRGALDKLGLREERQQVAVNGPPSWRWNVHFVSDWRPVDGEPSEPSPFNVEAAVHVLIARVDSLERILRKVAGAMPAAPMVRETMVGPNDHQRLEMIGAALQELMGPSATSEGER
jgi:hypothetical protein